MPTVISDENYNAQGTFYFPVGFRSESQHIAFWDAVAVPDLALERLLSDQAPGKQLNLTDALERVKKGQGAPDRILLDMKRGLARQIRDNLRRLEDIAQGRTNPEWQSDLARVEAEIRELEEKLGIQPGEPAEVLTQVFARPVARATGMITYLPAALDSNSRDRILDHEFELGDGRWMTARDIVDRFRTLKLDFLRP